MSRLFDDYVMVDWSASAKPATGADSIWVGVLKRDVRLQLRFEAHNPPTRKEAEALISRTLDELTRRGDRVLVGFDFPLGYPQGTAAALKLSATPAWAAMHAYIAREMKDKADNANNRFQLAAMMNRTISGGPFPFWGCPPRDALSTLSTKKARPHGPDDVPEHRRGPGLEALHRRQRRLAGPDRHSSGLAPAGGATCGASVAIRNRLDAPDAGGPRGRRCGLRGNLPLDSQADAGARRGEGPCPGPRDR
jgi:hypothetical protein